MSDDAARDQEPQDWRERWETLDALDDLLESGILVEWGEHYAFAQPLVAMVVRDGLSAARRAFLHRRAAEALERARLLEARGPHSPF